MCQGSDKILLSLLFCGCFTYPHCSAFGSGCRSAKAALHAWKHFSLTVATDLSTDVNIVLHLLILVMVP
jgi:hypothetical protein